MRNRAPVATIVMPAFNEAARIGQSLEAIGAYAAARALPLELLVVDDGSIDATAATAAWHLPRSEYIRGRVLSYSANRGKGYAVRYGLLAARAPIALFSDADLSTPIVDERPTDVEPERFEAALGVMKRKAGRLPENEIERPAGQLTPPWLMNADQPAVDGPRSDGEVQFAVDDRSDQLVHLRATA